MNSKAAALTSGSVNRIASVDAYRGFVMFLMMAEVLTRRRSSPSRSGPQCRRRLEFLAFHQTHAEWRGCSLHDLIQPSFTFLVGVALPFSLASRIARGQHQRLDARPRRLAGVRCWSRWASSCARSARPQTNFTFEDTLTQIGLGYLPLFLLGFAKPKWQWLALAVILVGYWAAFALYPLPGPDFDYAAVGVTPATGPHAQLHRLRRPLEQEHQPGLGVRPLVSEPVPAPTSRLCSTAAVTPR